MKIRLAVFGCLLYLSAVAQQGPPEIQLRKIDHEIVLDGVLDDQQWENLKKADGFSQYFPIDSGSASGGTEISMLYTDDMLYVGIKCSTQGSRFVTPSLKRDFDFVGNDNITLLFDTYNDKTNAFVFGINPFGVRREFFVSNGGRQFGDNNDSWDNKWFGEAKMYDNYWTAELAIPFNSIRYQKGTDRWRFQCYRNDTQLNEISSWIRIPREFILMDLSYMGEMIYEAPLDQKGSNISLIPYASGGTFRNFEDPAESSTQWQGDIGGDAKIGLTPGLNLDVTLNPDFSQVEVDEQVTNLNRFEILFPEKRQFFLENADLFSSFGLTRINPFFSRRIGVAIDSATGQNIQNPILYGLRLSGKLNEKLRIGALNMSTQKLDGQGLPVFNYSVGALEQRIGSKSNIAFIFVNKQAINGEENSDVFNDYNRVAGLEYRLASADNRWTGKTFYHQAFTPLDDEHKFTHGFQLQVQKRRYRAEWAHLLVGEGFKPEVGFVPRRDYFLMSPEGQIYFYPTSGRINTHSFLLDTRFFLQIGKDGNTIVPEWGLSERQFEFSWNFQLDNFTRGSLQLTQTYLTLLNDFDPTRLQEDDVFLPAGSDYSYLEFEGNYSSDLRKNFIYELNPSIGSFFNGFRAGLAGGFTYRFQPYGNVSLEYNYNYVRLDDPFEAANIWLVGPRFDITFSKKLFFNGLFQYNNQFDNININARLQWRFAPVSDFFLVYTDNYNVEDFSQFVARNRAIVAKVTYWLNL